MSDPHLSLLRSSRRGALLRDARMNLIHNALQAIEGTGLGLSISRDIVLRHGGSIELESAPARAAAGEGTR